MKLYRFPVEEVFWRWISRVNGTWNFLQIGPSFNSEKDAIEWANKHLEQYTNENALLVKDVARGSVCE